MKHILLILSIIISGACSSQTTNEKIVSFIESKIGKKVGDGVCHTLVKKALNKSNSSVDKYKRAASNKEGMYGFRKDSLDVIPGDIVVFSRAKFVYENRSEFASFHVGVVTKVLKNGTEFMVAEQNTKGNIKYSVVEINYMNLNNKVKGKVKFYSPR